MKIEELTQNNISSLPPIPEGEQTLNISETSYTSYARYVELGGIINEKDYENALSKMKTYTLDRKDSSVRDAISAAVRMAGEVGIKLNNAEKALNPVIVLYVILRHEVRSEGDQQIFGEVLRMLEDVDSLAKLTEAYPNISFKYQEEK